MPDWIVDFFRAHALDCIFVFRFDSLHFIHRHIDQFPSRELDLDELPTRREAQINRIDDGGPGVSLLRERAPMMAMRLMEKILLPKFDRVFVSSPYEAEEVRRLSGYAHAEVLPNIYSRALAPLAGPPASRQEIFFVGHLAYLANADAVVYFCREILPLIRAAKGDGVTFRVVGKGTSPALESVRNLPGVAIMGFQESLEPFYEQATLVVVPLRAGTGTRLKILEAFTQGRPVVSTTIGAQGLEVTDRENILLADEPEAFAQACIELMEQPELAARLCKGGADLVMSHYTQDALRRRYSRSAAGEHALTS
jgi:glycosyltransferase involved in cell wall biosynthesis